MNTHSFVRTDGSLALCEEYNYRYEEHKSKQVIIWCQDHINELNLTSKGLTKFAQVVKDEFRCSNPIKAYRDYYVNEKKRIAVWTKRLPPKWWK